MRTTGVLCPSKEYYHTMSLRKIKSTLLAGLVVAGIAVAAWQHNAIAQPTNLVANPSVETADSTGSAPANWQKDVWGSNSASFQYKNTGYNSAKSVYVSVSNYKDGDAKWYFSPVAASANTTYTFTEHYQANIPTHIVAMSLDASDNPTYFDVDIAAPASASAWKTATYSVKTLASTKKLTILHVVEANGWLQLDDVSFGLPDSTPTPTPTPTPTGLVPNPSMEQANGANPTDWSHSQWGTLTAKYQYMNDGHTGSHSAKLTVSNYKDGDAKWVFTPQPLTKGKDYRFNMWYKTNTIPHVVAQYIKADGSEDYFGMPDPEPASTSKTEWQYYSDVFSVPQDAVAVSTFMFLSNNGWVQTDDYSIAPYTYPAFNRGIVTLTFDDAFEENVNTALPILNQYGLKTTQCYATQYIEGKPAQIANVQKFSKSGHETCAHSVTHPYLTKVSAKQLDHELQHSQAFLQQITGEPVKEFASPYGDYNAKVNTAISKYYASHRTTDEGFNAKDNFNPYRLRVQNMNPKTTLAQFQGWVNKAKADHTWLIIIYHMIGDSDLDEYDTYTTDFKAQMKWLATESGISVQRWDAAMAEVQAQVK